MESAMEVLADRVEKMACAGCQKVLPVGHLPSFSRITCPNCGLTQGIPAKFGQFLLVEPLGAGGMGMVYRGVDVSLGRFVAIKVMKKSYGDDHEFVRQFRKEAQATAALNHPNIVQIYSFGTEKGQPYIAMELVGGGRLDKMLEGGVQIEEALALRIHVEVTQGLLAASEVGLVHGDVKPENILFGAHGEAKVVDFGLAMFIGEQQDEAGVLGTPYYIAPEKAKKQKVDFRSDIYSLGATLFHVLAGKPPFDGPTPIDVVLARFDHPAPDLRSIRPDLHPKTAAVVARMLDQEPSMRHPSYSALLAELEDAQDEADPDIPFQKPVRGGRPSVISARPASIVVPRKPAEKTGGGGAWKILAASLAAVVVLAGLAGGYYAWQKYEEEQAALAERNNLAGIKSEIADVSAQIGALALALCDAATNAAVYADQTLDIIAAHPPPEAAEDVFNSLLAADNVLFAASAAEDIGKKAEELAAGAGGLQTSAEAAALLAAIKQFRREITSRGGASGGVEFLHEMHERAVKSVDEARQAMRLAAETAEKERREREERERKEREERERKAREDREKKMAETLALMKSIQADLDIVDAARGANAPLIEKKRFVQAADSLRSETKKLATERGREAAQAAIDSYMALEKLKKFIIASLSSAPFPRGWPTGSAERDIVGANEREGLIISLSAGTMKVDWPSVPPQQFANIARHCIEKSQKSGAEQSELFLAVALYCYESALFTPAEKLAAKAMELDSGIRSEIDRLMPGLLD